MEESNIRFWIQYFLLLLIHPNVTQSWNYWHEGAGEKSYSRDGWHEPKNTFRLYKTQKVKIPNKNSKKVIQYVHYTLQKKNLFSFSVKITWTVKSFPLGDVIDLSEDSDENSSVWSVSVERFQLFQREIATFHRRQRRIDRNWSWRRIWNRLNLVENP